MTKHKVTVCYEKWVYYTVIVEAANSEAAEAEAERLWNNNESQEQFVHDYDDGNGMIIIGSREIEDAPRTDQ